MDKFYVITNYEKDNKLENTKRVSDYLTEKGKICMIDQNETRDNRGTYRYTNPNHIPNDTDCIIVLGGDGTLIQAARDIVSKDIPFIGVNLGRLGYLAEIEKHAIESTLDHLILNQYQIESRIMLDGKVYRNDSLVNENIALNDIVINRSGELRLIDFKVYVNGQYLNLYSADGFIVSTPTGSTAYNLSAGGPIVEPSASVIVLTPICAHSVMHSRSIVLSANDNIEIEICSKRTYSGEERILAYDGDTSMNLKIGDRIMIRKSNLSTKIIKLTQLSFLETIRKKFSSQ